jgi:hypothetical protein
MLPISHMGMEGLSMRGRLVNAARDFLGLFLKINKTSGSLTFYPSLVDNPNINLEPVLALSQRGPNYNIKS